MKGVTHMEVVLIAIMVFASGVLALDFFIFKPEAKAEVTEMDRLKIQVGAIENKFKGFTELEKKIKDMSDVIDIIQNNTEDTDNFSKANKQEIDNLNSKLSELKGVGSQIKESLKDLRSHEIPNMMTVRLEEFKKPLVTQIQQSRAQRPVSVNWIKKDGHWKMVSKEVQYSRAEYLKKLNKQRKQKHGRNKKSQ